MAAKAKQAALIKLKAKPPISEEVLAQRKAARLAREEAQAVARAEKLAAREKLKAEIEAKKALEAANAPRVLTEAEKKAARDERYAARKNRRRR